MTDLHANGGREVIEASWTLASFCISHALSPCADASEPNHPPAPERVVLNAKRFEVVVKGRLSPSLIAAIDGFEVSRYDRGHTHLVGWVPDQARLHSTLELLRDLNIELVSVNPAKAPDREAGPTRSSATKGGSDA